MATTLVNYPSSQEEIYVIRAISFYVFFPSILGIYYRAIGIYLDEIQITSPWVMRGSCFGKINSMLLVQLGNDLCYMFSLQNQFLIFKSKHTFLSNAPGPFQFQEWINPAHSSVAKVVLEQHGYAYNLKVFLET